MMNNNPKVIFISSYPPAKCGIAEYTRDLRNSLKKQEVNTKIVEVEKLTSSNPLVYWKLIEKLMKEHCSKKDIIHIQFQLCMYGKLLGILPGFFIIPLLILIKNKISSKIILTLHDLPSKKDARSMELKWKCVACYYILIYFFFKKFADKVIVHSKNSEKIAISEWGFNKNKIKIIPLGLRDRYGEEDSKKFKRKIGCLDKKIILLFGYARGFKNYLIALKALTKLDEEIILVITAGLQSKKHEKNYEEIKNQIKKLKIEERVKILGFVEDKEIPNLLDASDIILFPYTKTFGDFSSASMALGLTYNIPVLAANIHPFENFKKENKCIETFDWQNDQDLVEKIKELLYDKSKINYLKKQSKSYYEKNNWENVAKKTKELYFSLNLEKK